ncbi:DUF6022 family protein [Shimazuella kribbensis]|uniref:DUF6022 family protein n=1 Tax=Shimazuella kribbensis TaxID=139808 RepID=UPI0003FF8BF8|nr:DUF6022 family protein [Shimazuella kribbensis]
MATTLASYLENNQNEHKIFAVGEYIEEHVTKNWDVILTEKKQQLEHAFATVGEPSYGTYLNFLYMPLHTQLEEAGLSVSSRLPGNMDISREWGTNPEETDQHRCLWSTLYEKESGQAIGTIGVVLPHDHTKFRVPSKPPIFALTETEKDDVVTVLSKRYEEYDFANLMEFHEYVSKLRTNQ